MNCPTKAIPKSSVQPAVIFTVCSANYIAKALAMCQSALDQNDNVDLVIAVLDRKRDISFIHPRITIQWVEDLNYPQYLQCAFKYNVIELNTAVKPFLALSLSDRYEKVIYLDPDVLIFSSLEPILKDLDNFSTILSPHALTPYDGAGRPDDIDLLRFGSFNLGFFAIKASPHSHALLEWWHQRCQTYCFYEPSQGLGVDQKWMDLAPCFFDEVHVTKHPGLNVAFWNLHERSISFEQGVWRVNDVHPLLFVHFSSFDENDPEAIARKQTRFPSGSRPDFTLARNAYAEMLVHAQQLVGSFETHYGYAAMSDGSFITESLRRFYAAQLATDFQEISDPFAVPGPVHSFAKRNKLLTNTGVSVAHINFNDDSQFARQKRLINIVLKIGLRILGPTRYAMLMRYMATHASILKQHNLLN
jgi:hypothetical protein